MYRINRRLMSPAIASDWNLKNLGWNTARPMLVLVFFLFLSQWISATDLGTLQNDLFFYCIFLDCFGCKQSRSWLAVADVQFGERLTQESLLSCLSSRVKPKRKQTPTDSRRRDEETPGSTIPHEPLHVLFYLLNLLGCECLIIVPPDCCVETFTRNI